MTDTISDGQQPALPGLDALPVSNVSPLVAALRRTIRALDEQGLLSEVNALDLGVAHVLARSVEMKLATGRASTIANDVAELLRIKQNIIAPPELGDGPSVDAQLVKAMDDFNAALDADTPVERT